MDLKELFINSNTSFSPLGIGENGVTHLSPQRTRVNRGHAEFFGYFLCVNSANSLLCGEKKNGVTHLSPQRTRVNRGHAGFL